MRIGKLSEMNLPTFNSKLSKKHAVILGVGVSLLATVLFFFSTNLIRGSGNWYSQSYIYRMQTEAFLSGHVSLSSDPKNLTYDEVFFNGKLQQVWGLGAPALRLPFEIIARLFAFNGFSDRLVLGFYLWLTVFSVFWTAYCLAEKIKFSKTVQILTAILLAFLVPFLPQMFALARTRFIVYEEAVFYAYLVSVMMMAGTVLIALSEKKRWLFPFVFLCGFAGFFRPTALIYSVASVLVLLVLVKTPKRRLAIVGLFLVGCLALGASNYARFGKISDFGHWQNVDLDPINRFETKFGSPFSHAPILSAAEELASVVFFSPNFNNQYTMYMSHFFPGQVGLVRQRNFYSKTFGLPDLALLTFVFGVATWFLFRRKIKPLLEPELVVWSLVSFFLMFGFYLYTPAISSRYVADFSAGIVGMVFASAFFIISMPKSWKKSLMFALLAAYGIILFAADYQEIHDRISTSQAITWSSLESSRLPKQQVFKPIGSSYGLHENFQAYGIFGNGNGWDVKTGAFQSAVLIYTENMSYLKLSFFTGSKVASMNADFFQNLEIKIGKTIIKPLFIKTNGDITDVIFNIPEEFKGSNVVWPVFIKMLPENRILQTQSRLPLLRVEWRS